MSRLTGYFLMLTGSAPRMQLRFTNIIITNIISIFSCDAMQVLITAAKCCEREEECDETPEAGVSFGEGNGDHERR